MVFLNEVRRDAVKPDVSVRCEGRCRNLLRNWRGEAGWWKQPVMAGPWAKPEIV
jgi:hypothetical protein